MLYNDVGLSRPYSVSVNVLDIETYKDGASVIPYCVCAIIDNEEYAFYQESGDGDHCDLVIDCLNKIVNVARDKVIEMYIHNLNFDGIILVDAISKKYVSYQIVSDKTNIYLLKINYCGKTILFKCSYKIIPMSLQALGDFEKFPKKSFPYKFVNKLNLNYIGKTPPLKYWESSKEFEDFINKTDNRNFDFNLKEVATDYCLNDARLTRRILMNIFTIIDQVGKSIRKKSLSASSISHKFFFEKYNKKNIEESLPFNIDSYVRPSYFGGRCEVFGNIQEFEHIKYYDFPGMYGQCMLEKFHFGKCKFVEPREVKEPGFYNIDYISSDPYLPILPSHEGGKLMFLNGTKNGTF